MISLQMTDFTLVQTGVGIVWFAGVVQTLVYLDFFYYYATCVWYGKKLTLPTTS